MKIIKKISVSLMACGIILMSIGFYKMSVEPEAAFIFGIPGIFLVLLSIIIFLINL